MSRPGVRAAATCTLLTASPTDPWPLLPQSPMQAPSGRSPTSSPRPADPALTVAQLRGFLGRETCVAQTARVGKGQRRRQRSQVLFFAACSLVVVFLDGVENACP